MPRLYSTVSEIDEHIVLPVATQTVHKFINELNFRYILKDYIYIDTNWTTTTRQKQNHAPILRQNLLKVNVEVLHPTNMKWDFNSSYFYTSTMISEKSINHLFPNILDDRQGRIFLKEMYVPMTMNLNGTMTLKNRDHAYEFQSLLFRRFATGTVFSQTISYDYPIPQDIIAALFNLYRLRKFDKPYTFKEWMDECSNKVIGLNVNRTNTASELVIKKTLFNSLMTVDYTEDKPTEVKTNRQPTQYECNFTITIQFQRPDMLTASYPAVIDNELIPAHLVVTHREHDPIQSMDAPYPLQIFEDQINNTRRNVKGVDPYAIQCPFYDDWQVPYQPCKARSYKPFYISIFLLDDDQQTETTIDLNGDLGDGYTIDPKILNMLKIQGWESFKRDVIYNIAVYVDDHIIGEELLKIDENLKLTIPVNPKRIHAIRRIVVSEISNIAFLNSKWYPYLPGLYPDIIIGNDPDYDINGNLTDTVGGNENDARWTFRIFKNTIIARNKFNRNK